MVRQTCGTRGDAGARSSRTSADSCGAEERLRRESPTAARRPRWPALPGCKRRLLCLHPRAAAFHRHRPGRLHVARVPGSRPRAQPALTCRLRTVVPSGLHDARRLLLPGAAPPLCAVRRGMDDRQRRGRLRRGGHRRDVSRGVRRQNPA